MQPRDVKTKEDAKAIVEERNASQVKVGVFDIDGVLRGKYMSRTKFLSALEGGFGFCDVVLGWDTNDQLYDNVDYTGWHTAYPDAWVNIVPDSCREIPSEGNTLFFLCEFTGPAETICPRGLLRRVLERADGLGFKAWAACEFEFFLFEETPKSVRDKHYQQMTSITPGFFGYSVLRSSVMAEFYNDFMDYCNAMDMPMEGFHTETGPGVLEAALAVDSALNAADKAALFKTFTKVYAQRNGMMATFMAKWSANYPGQSGHMHVSLHKKDGTSAFYDEAGGEHKMSETMRHFIGGQQALMPEFLAMIACTVNSYTRLIPVPGHRQRPVGALKTAPVRCAPFPVRPNHNVSSTGFQRPTLTPTLRWRLHWHPACGVSKTRLNPTHRLQAPLTMSSSRPSEHCLRP